MSRARLVLTLCVVLGACGGAPERPEEEVTAAWTSGDDAALEGAEGSSGDGEE